MKRRRLQQHHRQATRRGTRCCVASPPFATWAGRCSVSSARSMRGRQGPAHLSVWRHDFDHQRAWRFPLSRRSAAIHSAPRSPDGADRRRHDRRQPGRGAAPAARATHAGGTQIKLTAGGGVSSPFSPLDVSTFTEDEMRAAVEAAENWGTYVAAHAYTSAADPTGYRCRREVSSSTDFDGRADRQAHGGKGNLVEHPAVSRLRRHGGLSARAGRSRQRRTKSWRGSTMSTSSPRSTSSRRRSAPTSCFPRPSGAAGSSPGLACSAGIRRPKC